MAKTTVQEIRLGAIYKFSLARRLHAADAAILLAGRLGMKSADAKQLVEHWFASRAFVEAKNLRLSAA